MSSQKERPFDILVYGATGFTGKRVAQYISQSHPDLALALAGRSESKLLTVASELNLSPSSIFVAPVNDPTKLKEALRQAAIVLACAGPYRHVGCEIVEAAIQTKTDYLDLCGEPQFFDDMLVQHNQAAQKSQTLIVSACAFDCVPSELSAELLKRTIQEQFHQDVSGIQIVHTFEGCQAGNATTYHAAVDGFNAASNGELRNSRQAVKHHFDIPPMPPRPETWSKDIIPTPGFMPLYDASLNTYLMKFIGADAACISASDRYMRMFSKDGYASIPPPKLSVCFGIPDQVSAFKFLAYGGVFSTLAKSKWGVDRLHAHPELFTNGLFQSKGPTEDQLKTGTFVTHSVGYGTTKEQYVKVTCRGPEPGYVATPKVIVALALTVLRHREKLRFEGGVVLPGALFGDCEEVYDVLRQEGIEFDIVESSALSSNASDSQV